MKLDQQLRFVCIGSQKAGTTSFHDILVQHPNVGLPSHKETQFFIDDAQYKKGLSYYFNYHFKGTQKNAILGEVNPQFCYVEKTAQRLKQHFKDLKVVMIIRNPVDRAFSHYQMTQRRGLENLSFEIALEKEKERLSDEHGQLHHSYADRGLYSNQIERYQKLFGVKNVKVIIFDDFIKSTPKVMQDVCDFIEVPQFDFNFDIQSNQASESKSKWLRNFLYRPSLLKKFLGKLLMSQKVRDNVAQKLDKANLKPGKKERLNGSTKKKIYQQYFINEIEALEKMLQKDLSAWKNYE